MKRKDTGNLGEKLARDFLKKRGYRIKETNYRCRYGEIDIVAEHKGCLVFVEVRTKQSSEFGSPEESITSAKMDKLRSSAFHYQQSRDTFPEQWRIDFVGIELDGSGKLSRIELTENAVGEA